MKRLIKLGKRLENYISIIGRSKKKKINGLNFITDIKIERICFNFSDRENVDIREKIEYYSSIIDTYKRNIRAGISGEPYLDSLLIDLYSYVIKELKECTSQAQLKEKIKKFMKLENEFTKRGYKDSFHTCEYFMLRGTIKVIIKELRGEF